MALVGSASEQEWQWAVDEEAAPVTSRSPSFVRIKSSESPVREPLESLVVLAEPVTRRLPNSEVPRAKPPSDPLGERDVLLRVAILRLEDSGAAEPLSSLRTELEALADTLHSFARAPELFAAETEGEGLLQHAYEWATNVAERAHETLTGAGRYDRDDSLSLHEYASLFVCAILEPMLDAAVEAQRRARRDSAVAQLGELRERIFWMNVEVKRFH